MDLRERFRGALLGLAAGDALGATVEFKPPGTFKPVTDFAGGGPFGLRPGQWTDDTSMAMCLAESLVECDGFDPADQLARYVRWYREGYWSCTGRCFDIGTTTVAALHRFERTKEPFCGSTNSGAAGNGCLMRLAPAPLFFAARPAEAVVRAGESSRTTHGSATCVDACRYFGGLIVGVLGGIRKEDLFAPRFSPTPLFETGGSFAPEIDEIAAGSFLWREPPEIRGAGYVVKSLEAALWAFAKARDFRDGALRAVNLGDDADTTAAIYGQIAGAYFGVESIPAEWREKIYARAEIEELADRLLDAARQRGL